MLRQRYHLPGTSTFVVGSIPEELSTPSQPLVLCKRMVQPDELTHGLGMEEELLYCYTAKHYYGPGVR